MRRPPAGVDPAILLGEVLDGENSRGLAHSEVGSLSEGCWLRPEPLVARVSGPGVVAAML